MTDIFDQETTGASPTDTSTNTQQSGDTLAALVGEGKKYKTVEDLAKSRLEADMFIEKLKSETAEMRELLAKKTEQQAPASFTSTKTPTLEEVLAKIEAAQAGNSNQSGVPAGEDMQELIKKSIEEHDTSKTRKTNREVAHNEIIKRFNGDEDKAKSFMKEEAKRLNITTAMLGELSETSPAAFRQMLGLAAQPTNSSSVYGSGNVNSSGTGNSNLMRNNAYYNKLRKEMGSEFYAPKIQQQLMKDRMSMTKEQFYSTN